MKHNCPLCDREIKWGLTFCTFCSQARAENHVKNQKMAHIDDLTTEDWHYVNPSWGEELRVQR